jgi:hypothetical protein
MLQFRQCTESLVLIKKSLTSLTSVGVESPLRHWHNARLASAAHSLDRAV